MLSRPMNRRSLVRGTGGVTAAALLAARGVDAKAQGTPMPAAAANQEFRIAARTTQVNLDPHLTYNIAQIGTFTYFMWSGLTKLDANLEAVPDIATSWDISEGGKIYTFHLDPNRTFADGSPITAQDVVWSWTRSLDPATESLVAGSYLGAVVGARDYWLGETPDPPTSYRALDDYTFQVELIEPRNYFPEILVHPSAFVVKQSDVEAGSEQAPWPTIAKAFSGPYVIESYSPGERLELTASPSFPVEQTIQRITYRLVEDPQTQFLLYQNDEVDFTQLAVPDAANIINEDPTYRDELIGQPQWWSSNLYLRMELAPFEDEQVRRAFMMAINEDLLIEAVLQDLNPNIDGIYYPGMDVYTDDISRITFDPEAAREVLAQSSYGSAEALPPISFYIAADEQTGTEARLAAAIQEMWREHLGVQVQSRVVATYAEMLESDVQIVIAEEALHYPDAAGIAYFRCQSGSNIAQFCDPEVEAMLEEAASTQDEAESTQVYREIQNTLLDRAAFYPLYQVVAFVLVKPYVMNFAPTAMYTFPAFEEVYIAEH